MSKANKYYIAVNNKTGNIIAESDYSFIQCKALAIAKLIQDKAAKDIKLSTAELLYYIEIYSSEAVLDFAEQYTIYCSCTEV